MNEQQKAYNKLLQGIQNYVRDIIDKYTDKTYVGIVRAISDDGYVVEINGGRYPDVNTSSGNTCSINETVHVLVPQGNFSNMFIIK